MYTFSSTLLASGIDDKVLVEVIGFDADFAAAAAELMLDSKQQVSKNASKSIVDVWTIDSKLRPG